WGGLLAEQLLDPGGVRRRDRLVERQAAGAPAGLALEEVPAVRLLAHELAATGGAETLLGTGVRLVLRHGVPYSRPCPGTALSTGSRRFWRLRSGCYASCSACSADVEACAASCSCWAACSAAFRSRVRRCSLLAPPCFFLCGPMTIVMFRPSSRGALSTEPRSLTSSASRWSRRMPISGRDCSRPRNMIMTLTLSPPSRNRTTCPFLVAYSCGS